MKLKIKAEPEDLLYFVIFAIALLYLVAIIVLNMWSISQNAEVYGFSPFKAFTGNFLPATITIYILLLGGIMFSVSKSIFDRDEGFGFAYGKVDKGGYSRWAKPYEIKKMLKSIKPYDPIIKYAGIAIIANSKKVWVDNGESHSLVIGSTGSGKTRRLVNPLIKILSKKGESMILTDPKGELYEENAATLKSKGYNIVLLNLRDPEKGNAWNPLMLPYKLYKQGSDKANELLNDLAANLLYDEKKADDPFWEKTSADYFTGLALGLFEDAKAEEINLNSISLMTTVGEEKYGASNYIKEYFSAKDPSKPAYINVASTINAPNDTKASILSVFRQKIKLFAITEHLSEMLSYSNFDMQDIGKKKTAVFINIQDEKKTYHALATVFVKQCYETLIDVAQANNGKLPIRTNFILDEFANMPPLKDVTTMITAARSRQIRFNLIIQNFAQLNKVYGKEEAETIKGNCANMIYLLSKELNALEEISKLCGEKKVITKEGKETGKPLITISDLQHLKMGNAIIIKDRVYPFKTKLPDISNYNFMEPKSEGSLYPVRERKLIALFDIRAFVKQQKKDSLFGAMDDSSNTPQNDIFRGFSQPNDNIGNNNFNIDDLIKKIDSKIMELEKEDENQKDVIIDDNKSNNDQKQEESSEEDDKKVVNINPDIDKIINDEYDDENTDDQFFDDFFSDEE